MTNPPHTIVGVELEPWEQEYMAKALGPGRYVEQHLDDAGDIGQPETLIIFIYSRITAEVLKQYPSLKFIATCSTGFDHIDIQACKDRGVIVSNVPSYGENTVAEHALALLLALSRKIVPSVDRTRLGDFRLDDLRGVDLAGKTAGVIGTGRIGQRFIKMLKGLEMKVIAFDAKPDPRAAVRLDFQYKPLEAVLKESDIISLHAPAIPSTFHLLNEERLRLMKPSAFLINTARGSLIDTQALLNVLESGHLAGVGLDVLEEECAIKEERELLSRVFKEKCDLKTLLEDHMLLEHPRVIVTPHNAFNSHEALERIMATTVGNVKAYFSGQPTNRVA